MKKLKALFSCIIVTLFVLNILMPIITYAANITYTENTTDTSEQTETTQEETEEIGRVYEVKEEKTWDISAYGDGSVVAKWTLKDKTLTISGNGEIKNWSKSSGVDFHSIQYRNIIEKVVIENGITNLGEYIFYNFGSLTNIKMANSVTSIGRFAFYGCSSLINIEIPEGVTILGICVFSGCSSLTNIVIPNSVTSIGGGTFGGCSSLISMNLQSCEAKIDGYSLKDCSSLREIKVDSTNQKYASIDGVLFNKDKTRLIVFPRDGELKKYSIPNGVEITDVEAFYGCGSLTNIEIPSSVIAMYNLAFEGCNNLEEIKVDSKNQIYASIDGILYNKDKTEIKCYPAKRKENSYIIPNSVTRIADNAFKGCSNLTNINIPNSVTSIGHYAFFECSSLTNIVIPNSVTSIGDAAFKECSSLTNIEIPSSVTSIGWYAFEGCSNLTNIKIPNSVTSIGSRAFVGCKGPIICKTNSEAHKYAENNGKEYILLDNQESYYGTEYQIKEEEIWDISKNGDGSVVAKWSLEDRTITISGSGEMGWSKGIDEYRYKNVIEKVIIKKGITYIERLGFEYYSSLNEINVDSENQKYTSIDGVLFNKDKTRLIVFPRGRELKKYSIPNGVEIIDVEAFYGCGSLTNIEIPSSVTSIKGSAFSGCSSLTNIEIPNSVTSIGNSAFKGCSSLTNIEIPSSVTSIGWYAFSGCSSLSNITIPNSVKSIEDYVFCYCSSLREINVDNDNQKYTSIDGVLYNKNKTELKKYPSAKQNSSYTIPSSVTSIGSYAFDGCSSLKNINIPNSVKSIGDNAFRECSSLTNIEIPNGVTIIGSSAFRECRNLTNIEMSNSVTSIGEDAFSYCSSLTNIVIPNSVTSIENWAFYNCSSLTNIVIPNSVTSIANSAFKYCKGPIICKTNSEEHRYAEDWKVGYILDEEPPEIVFTPKEFNKSQKQVSIKVDVTDLKVGVDESSLKYLWSTKEEVSKEEIETSFTNVSQITSPEKVTGTYYLYIYASDLLGNETLVKSNPIVLDNTLPKITGLEKNVYFSKVKPVATDEHLSTIELTKDGNKVTTYTNGAEITEVGEYKLTATDEAGNVTEVEFEIEKIPDGQDVINYVLNPSELTNKNVKVTLSKKDATKYADLKIQISTDGEIYEDVTEKTLEQNGKIYARYAIDELAGVPLEINVTNIDKTAPKTEVTYSTTELTKENVIATITANEKVKEIEGWTKSADEKVLTKEYERNTATEGEKVVVKDIAGNEVEETIKIANIDKEAPKVTGVQNGRSYSKKATPLVEDENLESVILVKIEKKQNEETNEEEIIETEVEGYKNGDTITEIGDYKLTATDKIGHITTVEFSIKEIPDTKDVVEVTKSTEEITNQDVVVTIAKKDGEEYKDLKVEVSLDNETYKEQTENTITKTLTENGIIYVRVVKEDIIGEVLEIEVNNIDKTAPTATVTYSTTNPTNQNVIATITASEEVQAVSGWTLSNNKKVLTKTYTANTTATGEEITIKDLAGNETKALLKITNIDKTAPTATVTYSTTNPTNQNVTVTITANEKIQVVEGWNLSGDGLKLTKTYAENTQTTGEEVTIKDLVGNEAKAKVIITNIDRISPTATITYSNTNLTNQNVTVTITANEKVQQVSGWTLSNDGLKLTKTYTANTSSAGEQVTVKDLAGNETKGTIKIANIDKTAPTATVTYSTTNPTNQNVTVTITANEKVQQVSGWTLSSDGLKLSKTYIVNTTANGQEVTIKDLVGNETKKTIKIANIDKQVPIITGVEKNHRYFRKAKPEITEENIKTIELLKSGKQVTNYTNGQEIKEAGNYKLTVEDKAGNSTTRIFTIYDIETKEYKEQTIGNTNYIGKINVGEKTSQIEKLLKSVESFKITRNGSEIYSNTNRSNDQVLATGDKIEFEDQEYIVIVTGDINKDGKSNIVDLAKCMKVVLGKKQLDTIEGMAADTNFDGKVNIIDLAKIRKLSLNK